jgi:hypothetical protein
MKRLLFPALLLLCLLFLLPNAPGVAHQAAQSESQPRVPFQKIREGVSVLKIWEITDLDWPRVVLLRLSVPEYAKFFKDPKGFVNDPQIYGGNPTHKVIRASLAPVPKQPEFNCLVIVGHDPSTLSKATSSCVAAKPTKP